ncbi:MAG: isocitrate/isopropylmalate dehydrogenase family protein [Chloroflexi bacterium]|nr:MAG: isocitrate/isopropylmalate dehydrogenase family protein [Chloroflexota bacterium]
MPAHTITLIPGDGVGPEVSEAARRAIDATGVDIEWEVHDAGLGVIEKYGQPMPNHVLESIRRNKVAIKGPLTTPVGKGIRSVNVALRKDLDLYALVRPCKSYPGVRSFYHDIDLVIVRENTEDLYAGIEFAEGSDEALRAIELISQLADRPIRRDSGISIKPISVYGTERVFRFAFRWARANGRRKVTAVHKANIMKHTDGLWLRVAERVAGEFPDLEFEDRIVDNMAMQLVQKPELYDVLVMPNLYGDILSDLAAGLIGGLGLAGGGNMGDEIALFEATHGSAPKYTGQNKTNPMAMMFSGMMMLRHIGELEAGDRLERALAEVIAEGRSVTYDMKPDRDDPTAVGTSQVADAVVAKLRG